MKMKKIVFLFLVLFYAATLQAQKHNDTVNIRKHINNLASVKFAGRGYVDNGMGNAANYIAKEFKKYGLQFVPPYHTYMQHFETNIVSFPGAASISINGKRLNAGVDFLIDPASPSVKKKTNNIRVIDCATAFKGILDKDTKVSGDRILGELSNIDMPILLLNIDSLKSLMNWKSNRQLAAFLPDNIFLIPLKSKPLWYPARKLNKAKIVYLYETAGIDYTNVQSLSVHIQSKYHEKFAAQNVIGMVPGKVRDSFIVFTAHYDHIGKMGKNAMFPGASDNASGTAMMLNLAAYYAKNPPRYNIVFMAFAAEEAGLLGSVYYTQHPMFSLKKIKFLINLDIMGDATKGFSVVNGESHPHKFEWLEEINKAEDINFKEVVKGGKAANSDHHPFDEKGVPAIFIFSRGGPGHYHNTFDTSESLALTNLDKLAEVLRRFTAKLQGETLSGN